MSIETKELAYAWRDTSDSFTEHAALAQAIGQVLQQSQALPPNAYVVNDVEITFEGEETLDDPTAPNQIYAIRTTYAIPQVVL